MISQLTQKRALIRMILTLGFFIACVIIPVAKIIPFFERSEVHGMGDPYFTFKYSYFFDSFTIHELEETRYYFMALNEQIRFLAFSGWIMVLLGILVLLTSIWAFFNEKYALIKYNFHPIGWVSILVVISILIEWLLIVMIIIQEPWKDVVKVSRIIWYPPLLNIYLLVIMIIGIICLLSANWLNRILKAIESKLQ